MAVALTITAALVLGTLGAVAPATAAPASTSTLTSNVPLPAAATAAAPTAIAPIPGPPATPVKTALSGTVTAHTTTGTKPLAGVSVRVFNAAGTQYGFTDQNGKYSVAGLAAVEVGSYLPHREGRGLLGTDLRGESARDGAALLQGDVVPGEAGCAYLDRGGFCLGGLALVVLADEVEA